MPSSDTVLDPVYDFSSDAEAYARLAIEGDAMGCTEIVDRVLARGIPMVEVYEGFFGGAMRLVGEWYHTGAIDVSGEHFASELTERLMHHAASRYGQKSPQDRTALLGCGPESWHVIGLRMLGDVLYNEGWRTLFLGPNMPVASFLKAVESTRPHLVLLSCSALRSMDGALELVRALRSFRRTLDPSRRFIIGVGGRLVTSHPTLFRDAGADFMSRDLGTFTRESIPEIERVLDLGGEWGLETFTSAPSSPVSH